MKAPNTIPVEAKRGKTTLDAYKTARSVSEGDDIRLVVEAISEGDIDGCDDRREGWTATVTDVRYDGRKNIHTLVVECESEYGDSGVGYVRYHTHKDPKKGLSFGGNSQGSRMWFDSPVDFLTDDRERTVVNLESN